MAWFIMAPKTNPPFFGVASHLLSKWYQRGLLFQSLSNRFMCEIGAKIPNLKIEIISEIILEIHKFKMCL